MWSRLIHFSTRGVPHRGHLHHGVGRNRWMRGAKVVGMGTRTVAIFREPVFLDQ